MLRVAIGIFFVLHGLVHLLWFVVPWQITAVDGLPYSTIVLAQRVDVGKGGIRVIGVLWLVATLVWVGAGLGLIFLAPWWQGLTIAAALFSSVLCVVGLPEAKYGLLINLLVLGLLFLNGRFLWLPTS